MSHPWHRGGLQWGAGCLMLAHMNRFLSALRRRRSPLRPDAAGSSRTRA
ncbi:conserved hypothetical protein [Burkholderia cenocepacia]|nr:hypothetical protein P355_5426 [Burkholderia cenocepacia KC-01]WJN75709.1 hypothetical protein OH687_02515 [Burkholderia anthina]SOT40266.1 conserved hypothetical protein [Burkholderia cenocepacia]